jgi:ATP-dependent phosphofructokinase / diphosphate-dependent phosphofructokinase
MLKGNAVIGQSGGPTSVINSSLSGVIDASLEMSGINKIYGMNYGIEGFMEERLIDLGIQDESILKGLRSTPSSALGGSRHKLRDEDFPQIMDVIKKFNIRYFFLIGGNDTMDTVHRVETLCQKEGWELKGIGIPKTVDNDLYGTDHTPGFASAGRFNMLSVLQAGTLLRDMKRVDKFMIYQTIGRDAGWLAAATALARRNEEDAPHLIYCPERTFNKEQFLKDAKDCVEKYGWVSIVVSEGLKYADGTPVSASESKDKFNNIEYGATGGSSVGVNVHRILREATGWRGEFQITESLNMCAMDRAVSRDIEEAYLCGRQAVSLAGDGISGVMVTMKRLSNDPYKIEFSNAPLNDVAVRAKEMPDEYINKRGNHVTQAFIEYAKPLIGNPPEYVRLDMKYAEAE